MHFDLSARDRYVSGGGLIQAETTVTVAGTAPFRVTNTANVKVSYSTDGGLTFPTVLSASTPNDGTVSVTIPATASTKARFKVEAIGQPFFDLSHANLSVTTTAKAADLTATITGPATAANLTNFTETIKVKNNGPSAATAAAVVVRMPAGVTLVSAPGATVSTKPGGTYLTWNRPSIAAGSTVTFTATFRVKAGVHYGVRIPVTATSSVNDPNAADNTATTSIRLG